MMVTAAVWYIVTVMVIATAGQPGTAHAGFVDTYGEWRKLSALQKATYLIALWDVFSSFTLVHGAYGDADVPALKRCGERAQLDAAMLYDAVDGWYKRDTSNWDKPPFVAFYDAIVRSRCRNEVNEERRKRNLAPLQ